MKRFVFISCLALVLNLISCNHEPEISQSMECNLKCNIIFEPIACVLLPPNGYYFDHTTRKCISVYDCKNVPPFKTMEECVTCDCK